MAREQSESSLHDSSEHSWQATLGFFGLPDDPSDVVNGLIQRDGRSRAEQLHLILRHRKRGCLAAYEMLQKFRTICVGGYCAFGCQEEAALRLVDPSLRTSEYRPINIFINSYSDPLLNVDLNNPAISLQD
ncbi:hypothetical protein OROHE_000023 [Orobanche hederae]